RRSLTLLLIIVLPLPPPPPWGEWSRRGPVTSIAPASRRAPGGTPRRADVRASHRAPDRPIESRSPEAPPTRRPEQTAGDSCRRVAPRRRAPLEPRTREPGAPCRRARDDASAARDLR